MKRIIILSLATVAFSLTSCSVANTSSSIKALLSIALTDKIGDRETYMKGIDYSYYYEQSD